MNAARVHEFLLRGVPEFVVSRGRFELFERVQELAAIPSVFAECGLGPIGQHEFQRARLGRCEVERLKVELRNLSWRLLEDLPGLTPGARQVPDVVPVVADVAPGDRFVEETVDVHIAAEEVVAGCLRRCVDFARRPAVAERGLGNFLNADVSVPQVRAEPRRGTSGRVVRLIAALRIVGKFRGNEFGECLAPGD